MNRFFVFGYLALTSMHAFTWAVPTWTSGQYISNVVGENDIGAVIFDAAGQCNGIPPISIKVEYCPISNAANYLAVVNNTLIVLAKLYPLSSLNNSPYVPGCVVTCKDGSSGRTAETTVDMNFVSRNNHPPVWDLSNPSVIPLKNITAKQFIVATLATDRDADKLSDALVTYSVVSIDGSPFASGTNDFVTYEDGGASPRLVISRTPPWQYPSNHSVIVEAQDNPLIGNPNVITRRLILIVGPPPPPPVMNLSNSSSTTGVTGVTTVARTILDTNSVTNNATTVSPTPTSASNQGNDLPGAGVGGMTIYTWYNYYSSVSSSTARPSTDDCTESSFICNRSWIWVVLAFGCALMIALTVTVLVLFVKFRKGKRSVFPSPKSNPGPFKTYDKEPRPPKYRPPLTFIQ